MLLDTYCNRSARGLRHHYFKAKKPAARLISVKIVEDPDPNSRWDGLQCRQPTEIRPANSKQLLRFLFLAQSQSGKSVFLDRSARGVRHHCFKAKKPVSEKIVQNPDPNSRWD